MRLPAPLADADLYPLLRSCAGWGVEWDAVHDGVAWRFHPVLPEMDTANCQALREWMDMKRAGLRRELLSWLQAQKKPLLAQGQSQNSFDQPG